ncbi:hypothetical protein [uncultured Roseibium sp.]|uniref:hypothetical protein n=1 Tax=uncultured Roseibium sp. TaxID=1936171 RepID=UPI00260B957E|nr:hypothetical protein [uncultured Roseibium sp.]
MANTNAPKAPTHEVFHVVGDKDKARWNKIGIGWSHADGEEFNIVINYTPLLPGRTVIRKIKEKPEDRA